MKIVAISACLSAVLVASPAYAAQKPIRLNCKGEVATTVLFLEADKVEEKKDSATVDVLVDLERNAMKIDGWWGCFPSAGEDPDKRNGCGPVLPVTISESEIRFSANSKQGITELTINRYSGRMAVSSVTMALPALKAKWDSQSTSGEFSCTQMTKALF